MKRLLLKLANHIYEKYNITPVIKLNQKIIFQNHIYAIHTIELIEEIGCLKELKIQSWGVFDERINRKNKKV